MSDHPTPQQQPMLLPPSPSGEQQGVGHEAIPANAQQFKGQNDFVAVPDETALVYKRALSPEEIKQYQQNNPIDGTSWLRDAVRAPARQYFRHKRKGGYYTIISHNVKAKINGKWVHALLYKEAFLGGQYVRSNEDFCENFELTEPPQRQ